MSTEITRSKELLNKVYDHLDTIDVSKLSMREMEDFLGVVQKGQFLEGFGQIPQYGYGGLFGGAFNSNTKPFETNVGDVEVEPDAK